MLIFSAYVYIYPRDNTGEAGRSSDAKRNNAAVAVLGRISKRHY